MVEVRERRLSSGGGFAGEAAMAIKLEKDGKTRNPFVMVRIGGGRRVSGGRAARRAFVL